MWCKGVEVVVFELLGCFVLGVMVGEVVDGGVLYLGLVVYVLGVV